MADKVIQFEVWNECNNGCRFCSNKFVYNLSDEQKIRTLDLVIRKLQDPKLREEYQRVGFIGGEFFQGQLRNPEVKEKFMQMVDLADSYAQAGYFNQIWFCCTLIAKNQFDLYETIDRIHQKGKIWICTSYDTIGRFHTKEMLDSWDFNMRELKRLYPEVNINITSIITEDLIDKYMTGEFSPSEMSERYGCTYFFKPPMIPSDCTMSKDEFNGKVLSKFFPPRRKFLNFLAKFKRQEGELAYQRLFDTTLRADELIKTDYADEDRRMVIRRDKTTNEEVTDAVSNAAFVSGSGEVEETHNDTNRKCRHNRAYSPYVDSDECFYCDKEMIYGTV